MYREQSGLRNEGITVFIRGADYLLLVPLNTQQEDSLANNRDFFAGKEIFFNILVDFQNSFQILLLGRARGEVAARIRKLSERLGGRYNPLYREREEQDPNMLTSQKLSIGKPL